MKRMVTILEKWEQPKALFDSRETKARRAQVTQLLLVCQAALKHNK
jgi:hypothetical protein